MILTTFQAYADHLQSIIFGLMLRRNSCMDRTLKDAIENEIVRQTKLWKRYNRLAEGEARKAARRKVKHG